MAWAKHRYKRCFLQEYSQASATADALENFRPTLSRETQTQFLALLHTFVTGLPVPYALSYGALVGQLWFQDMLPWDDDIDLFCDLTDRQHVQAYVEGHPELAWDSVPLQDGDIFKVFFRRDAQMTPHPYPALDIFWLNRLDATTCHATVNKLKLNWTDIFPTQDGLFGGLKVACPNNAKRLLETFYPLDWRLALSRKYDHRNTGRTKNDLVAVPFEALQVIYPVLNETGPRLGAWD